MISYFTEEQADRPHMWHRLGARGITKYKFYAESRHDMMTLWLRLFEHMCDAL